MLIEVERVRRIELLRKPWQGSRQPLHHTRLHLAPRAGLEPATHGLTVRCSTY